MNEMNVRAKRKIAAAVTTTGARAVRTGEEFVQTYDEAHKSRVRGSVEILSEVKKKAKAKKAKKEPTT